MNVGSNGGVFCGVTEFITMFVVNLVLISVTSVIFVIDKVANTIKNACNVSNIPEGLYQVAVDMVCGEFLLAKKGSGELQGFEMDLAQAVLKQVQEGDTNVTFGVESSLSPEQRLNAAIDYLINYGKNQFVTYRRLKWD
jgi:hypothetical protein